jgi:hypothetical protein
MSSALWCVTNGRASAPPAIGCIIGVSTSRIAARVEEARMAASTRLRTSKTRASRG